MPFSILEGPGGTPVVAKGTADGALRVEAVIEGGEGLASEAEQVATTAAVAAVGEIAADIESAVDGLEAKADTANSKLDALEPDLEEVRADADATRVAAQSLDSKVATAANQVLAQTSLTSIVGQTDELEADADATRVAAEASAVSQASLDSKATADPATGERQTTAIGFLTTIAAIATITLSQLRDAIVSVLETIRDRLVPPTITGQARVAPVLQLAHITHTPASMISLGGDVAIHRRMDLGIAGGGTIAYIPARSCVRLGVDGVSGSRATYRQRMWCPYIPSTVQHYSWSAPFDAARAGQKTRAGPFDDENGIFVLQSATAVSLVVRSSATGSLVETPTTIPGLNPALEHTFDLFYQWPAGRAELWVDGARVVNISHAGGAVQWMGRGNLPFTVEIENDGTSAAGFVDLHHFCVFSEGASHLQINGVTVDATVTSIPTGGKLLMQARIRQTIDVGTLTGIKNREVYVPDKVHVDTTAGPLVVVVFANGTVTGTPSWNTALGDAGVEYDSAGVFVGADGLVVGRATIDTTTGSCEIKLGDINIMHFTATAGAFTVPGSEVIQVVGFARSGTVSSAKVTIDAARVA
jgi:hypothetical protein